MVEVGQGGGGQGGGPPGCVCVGGWIGEIGQVVVSVSGVVASWGGGARLWGVGGAQLVKWLSVLDGLIGETGQVVGGKAILPSKPIHSIRERRVSLSST